MYESFFKIQKAPFSMRPDPDLLFPTPQHREALAAMLYGILNREGFSVLWGEAGTGKTTILQAVMRQLPAAQLRCGLIINPVVSVPEFLEMTLLSFGVDGIPEGKPRRLNRLQQFLHQAEEEGRICVLIVDEAHRLTPELIEEIRLLTNFGSLQIVLAGQIELIQILDQPGMRQVKQRISVMASLLPLTADATREYITYRWMKAGGTHVPFTNDALDAVAEVSQGTPRLVNLLCDRSLLAAFAAGQTSVQAATVYEVGRDLRINPAPSESAVRREVSHIRLDSLGSTPLPDFQPEAEAESMTAVPSFLAPRKNGHRPMSWLRWPRIPRLRLKLGRSNQS